MCDQTTQNVIAEVVEEFTDEDQLFTAFDVSKKAQQSLKDSGQFDFASHRHRAIKNDVHRQCEAVVSNGLYEKELTDVGAPTKAFLYYPEGADPSSYVAQTRNDAAPTKQIPTSAGPTTQPATAVADTDDDGDERDTGGRSGDKRGTLCVPAHLLRAAGFAANDVAYVSLDQNTIVLSKQVPAGKSELTHYTVDHNTNVRITKPTLERINADNGYNFERANERVIVSAHAAD